MVCTGVLTGLLLFSLFSSGAAVEEVDPNTLKKIINYFENYKPSEKTDSGDDAQYAVAINVPADQCRDNFNLNTFLTEDNPDSVKNDLVDGNKRLYVGQQMVAARPKGSNSKIHSERALLMCEDSQAVAPVQNLLNKDNYGCVVFYTYNSPCLEYCLNQAKDDNAENRVRVQTNRGNSYVLPAVKKCILSSLSLLKNHAGPTAFVFSRVYRKDEGKTELLNSALKEVAMQVPLYKCDTNSCIKCLNNNEMDNRCLS